MIKCLIEELLAISKLSEEKMRERHSTRELSPKSPARWILVSAEQEILEGH